MRNKEATSMPCMNWGALLRFAFDEASCNSSATSRDTTERLHACWTSVLLFILPKTLLVCLVGLSDVRDLPWPSMVCFPSLVWFHVSPFHWASLLFAFEQPSVVEVSIDWFFSHLLCCWSSWVLLNFIYLLSDRSPRWYCIFDEGIHRGLQSLSSPLLYVWLKLLLTHFIRRDDIFRIYFTAGHIIT